MCLPAMGLIGSLVSAMGSIASASAQSDAQNRQASIYAQQAANERAAADYNASRQRDKAIKLISQQRASYLATGVSPGSGSPLDTISDTTRETELDVQAIKWNGELRARVNDMQAENSRAAASNSQTAGMFGAISPLIKSIGSIKIGGDYSSDSGGGGYGGTVLD